MKTFTVRSHQLKENLKWIPSGTIHEDGGNGSGNIQSWCSIPEKSFDTQKEADDCFVDYYTNLGYTKSNS